MNVMQRTLRMGGMLVASAWGALAFGHGHSIVVSPNENNQLVVSGGVSGAADGFASRIFVETGADGDPQDEDDFPGFGAGIYWTVPGFQISGLTENSGLYLQPLARPVRGTNPVNSQVLWYRTNTTNAAAPPSAAPATSQMLIRRNASTYTILTPPMTSAPPVLKIADPVAAEMTPDNHLLKYALPEPLPPAGAYAFFARLTSDVYAPSNPFLVVIDNGGLSGQMMLDAGAAINRAGLLAGDYNHDDVVDARDYLLWRSTLNSTIQLAADGSGNGVVDAADLSLWRNNFGLSFNGASQGIGAEQTAPEPPAAVLTLVAALVWATARPRRSYVVIHAPAA